MPFVFDRDFRPGVFIQHHPILKHLPNVEPQHYFIVTHELPTRVGLGSSAALALAACGVIAEAYDIDRNATGAGWQEVMGCSQEGLMACTGVNRGERLSRYPMWWESLLLFSTGGTHTESRNAPELDRVIRALALQEAQTLRDKPTMKTLAWCMSNQWERKMSTAPVSVMTAIQSVQKVPGFMSAKSTGSRGAGFGVVLCKNREKARDALVECGARVWLV